MKTQIQKSNSQQNKNTTTKVSSHSLSPNMKQMRETGFADTKNQSQQENSSHLVRGSSITCLKEPADTLRGKEPETIFDTFKDFYKRYYKHSVSNDLLYEIQSEAVKWFRMYQRKETESCKKWIDSDREYVEEREFQLYYQGLKDAFLIFFNLSEEDLYDN